MKFIENSFCPLVIKSSIPTPRESVPLARKNKAVVIASIIDDFPLPLSPNTNSGEPYLLNSISASLYEVKFFNLSATGLIADHSFL